MNRVAIIYKRGRLDAAILAEQLDSWLAENGIQTLCQENVDDPDNPALNGYVELPGGLDAVIVLGGDGTFLSVARVLAERDTPVVGVNLGAFGFMTEISRETCFRDLREILLGHYVIEERLRLEVSVLRGTEQVFQQSVLNDAVINKGVLARILALEVSLDGRYLTDYRADGLIVATPTGSTAYNLSAGGPIVYPTAPVIILAPICSFTLTNRPIIIPSSSRVEIKRGPRGDDVVLTCDGQVGCSFQVDDQIIISTGPNPLRLIKPLTTDYFEILRTKLQWGGNLRKPGE